MSEFHRMITYLYLYEQGMKSRNTGFAKIEKRKQQCLLEIHMKNTGCSMSPVPAYFYVQKEGRLAGIPLGSFSLTRGSGDFKTILDAENLKDSGYALSDVKGIYIPLTEQIILVSQWDDDEFHLEDFANLEDTEAYVENGSDPVQDTSALLRNTDKDVPAEDSEAPVSVQNTDTSRSAQSSISAPIQNTENGNAAAENVGNVNAPAENTANANADTPAENAEDINADTPAENVKPSSPTPKTQNHAPTDALKALEALPRSGRQALGLYTLTGKDMPTPESERPSGHSQADEPENWDLRWRFILENYPVMTPFHGDDRTLCVRMELKDLRQLPKQFWYFGNNSFLLHGFFNYRYFILGMKEEFGVKRWFIGVPGVFQNPERVMAALFGFPEFRSEKDSPVNTGQFGYWYCYLNELSEPSKK